MPSTIAITPSTVNRARIAGQSKALTKRLWQGKARRLDDDVVRERIERENAFDRRQKIVGDGAADAAIGEFDDVIRAAGKIAAAFQYFRVDADIAEFVDDEGEAAALGIFQKVANEGRLPGAEKAGDDRCRNFGKTDSWASIRSFGALAGAYRRSQANPERLAGCENVHRHR